jgi:Zn-dependent M28 family amino/carboxypeptidase
MYNVINTMATLDPSICGLISQVSLDRLEKHVKRIEGLRHGWENYDILAEKAGYIEDTFRPLNVAVENQEVLFHGKAYRNIIATKNGRESDKPRILLGAHYDAASGSPGADDNASGVAALLECAHVLNDTSFDRTIQFVAFTLEEPQPQTIHFLIGSDFFAKEARRLNIRYEAVLILESIGYTDTAEESQFVPAFIRTPIPKRGDFLGIIANKRSKPVMEAFRDAASAYARELITVPYSVPLSGRLIPETRFSDHAPFWDQGYPALMLTDTAMFRNPHYHTRHDRYGTLDFTFMHNVTKAVLGALALFGNQ